MLPQDDVTNSGTEPRTYVPRFEWDQEKAGGSHFSLHPIGKVELSAIVLKRRSNDSVVSWPEPCVPFMDAQQPDSVIVKYKDELL